MREKTRKTLFPWTLLTRADPCHVERCETSHSCNKKEILGLAQNDTYFVLSVVIADKIKKNKFLLKKIGKKN